MTKKQTNKEATARLKAQMDLRELKELHQRNDAFGHESTERRTFVDRGHRTKRLPSLDELDRWG